MANCPSCNTPDFYPSFSGMGECLSPTCKLFGEEHFKKTLKMPVTKPDLEKELANLAYNPSPHWTTFNPYLAPLSQKLTKMEISAAFPSSSVLHGLLGAVNVPRLNVVTALHAGNEYVHRDVISIGVHEVDIFIMPSPASHQRLRLLRLGDVLTFSLLG